MADDTENPGTPSSEDQDTPSAAATVSAPPSAPSPADSAPDAGNAPNQAPVSSTPLPTDDTTGQDQGVTTAVSVPTEDAVQTFVNGLPVPPTADDLNAQAMQQMQDRATGAIKAHTMDDWYDSRSTPGKAMALFGLMLGGAGSGLAHQPNALIDMMQKNISNDLQAQMANKTNANTWLSVAYAHQVQQAQIALDKAKLSQVPLTTQQLQLRNQGIAAQNTALGLSNAKNSMMLDQLHSMQDAANNAPSTIAPNAQQHVSGVIAPAVMGAINQNNQQTAAQLNAAFQLNQQKLRLLGLPDLAQSNEARFVPGVGNASVPLTGEDRQQILNTQNFGDQLGQYKNFVQGLSNADRANPAKINEGAVKAAELQSAFQKTIGGTYGENERNYINSIIPSDPTKFLPDIRVLPQINSIQGNFLTRQERLYKSKGLPTPAETWANAHPNDPRAAQILQKSQGKGQ